MSKIKIEVELSEHLFHAYEREAERTGKRVEKLVEKLVNTLIVEMEREPPGPPAWG